VTTLYVIEAPPRDAEITASWPRGRRADGESAPSAPVLVCLNPGWGGEGLLEAGIRWATRAGRALSAVYVLAGDRQRRRDVRAADRALLRARACAARENARAGLLVIRAPEIPEGLGAAASATDGEVLLWSGEAELSTTLVTTGVPFREVAWQAP